MILEYANNPNYYSTANIPLLCGPLCAIRARRREKISCQKLSRHGTRTLQHNIL